jgi:integral membrane sensor domain MASE1
VLRSAAIVVTPENLGDAKHVLGVGLNGIAASGDSTLSSELPRAVFRIPMRLAIAAGVATGYFISGTIGLHFATVHPSATAIWAPSGISLAACLLFGYWIWPAIFLGAFLVNAITFGSLTTSLGIGIGNTAEALIGVYLIRRYARGIDVFGRTSDVFRFIIIAVLSTPASATIGVLSL